MTDYSNPLLDALDEMEMDDALAGAEKRSGGGGFRALPKGRYRSLLTDWNTETVEHERSPLVGQTRVRATFETDHDGRTRKVFVDFTTYPATWPLRDGETKPQHVREFVLAGQLTKALGMRGKPFSEILEQARMTPVDLEVGVDKKKTDRNVVYAVHEAQG